jgi:hypothetical protein
VLSFRYQASKKRKATAQTVDDLPEGQIRASPPAPGTIPASEDVDDTNEDVKYSLHPDDPTNFLKLCTALRILIKRLLSDKDINHADRLIREYNTELIHVRCPISIRCLLYG